MVQTVASFGGGINIETPDESWDETHGVNW